MMGDDQDDGDDGLDPDQPSISSVPVAGVGDWELQPEWRNAHDDHVGDDDPKPFLLGGDEHLNPVAERLEHHRTLSTQECLEANGCRAASDIQGDGQARFGSGEIGATYAIIMASGWVEQDAP